MTHCVYIICEGINDAAFFSKLLTHLHGAQQLKRVEQLAPEFKTWFGDLNKPSTTLKLDLSLTASKDPKPLFFQIGTDVHVALRDGGGVDHIARTLTVDIEGFRRTEMPNTIGIVVDNDDEPASRFQKVVELLAAQGLAQPLAPGQFAENSPRVGICSLPQPGAKGMLETLLLALGESAYAPLHTAAEAFVEQIHADVSKAPIAEEWKPLCKPSGRSKAKFAAMVAALKPGKSTQVSLNDNRWVSEETKNLACLQPTRDFLDSLLQRSPNATAPSDTNKSAP